MMWRPWAVPIGHESTSARRELARLSPEKTAEAEARLEAFLNPAAAMEKDFEGFTEKELKDLEELA